jgi:hypothetical protein
MLYLLLIERKIRGWVGNREETARGLYPRADCVGCAMLGFSQLLGSIKGCFKGQSLNFMCT